QHYHLAREKVATSRARESEMWRLPGSSMFFDCAGFVTERLRSNPAKATIRATAWVTLQGSGAETCATWQSLPSAHGSCPTCSDNQCDRLNVGRLFMIRLAKGARDHLVAFVFAGRTCDNAYLQTKPRFGALI